MPIVIKPGSTFEWPVKVAWPENGEHVEYPITCEFRRLTFEDLMADTKDIGDGGVLGGLKDLKRAIAGGTNLQDRMLRRALVRVTEGLDVDEGVDTVDAVVAHPALSNAVFDSFMAAIRGGERRGKADDDKPETVREKN